jgi:hypothetical protein
MARLLPIPDLTLALFGNQSKDSASLAWQCRSNEGGVSVTKKSADRSWIEQPVHRGLVVASLYVVIGFLGAIGSIFVVRRIFQGRWEQIFWASLQQRNPFTPSGILN